MRSNEELLEIGNCICESIGSAMEHGYVGTDLIEHIKELVGEQVEEGDLTVPELQEMFAIVYGTNMLSNVDDMTAMSMVEVITMMKLCHVKTFTLHADDATPTVVNQ